MRTAGTAILLTHGRKNGLTKKMGVQLAKVTATDRYFCHKDHPGSSTVMTDKEAVEIESSDCLPFGHQREHTGTSVTDYKFTDQEYTNFT